MHKKLLQIACCDTYLTVSLKGQAGIDSPADGGVYLRRAQIEIGCEPVVRPGLVTLSNKFQQDENVL